MKPYSFAELMARVKTLLRRGPAARAGAIQIDDLEVDEATGKARRGGKDLELTSREFALLALLARHSGQVVTRSQISEKIWKVEYDGVSNVIDVHVRHLRAKVDDPYDRKLIRTVRGMGYALGG